MIFTKSQKSPVSVLASIGLYQLQGCPGLVIVTTVVWCPVAAVVVVLLGSVPRGAVCCVCGGAPAVVVDVRWFSNRVNRVNRGTLLKRICDITTYALHPVYTQLFVVWWVYLACTFNVVKVVIA